MPVEFPCLSSETMTVNITLPEGYVLVDKPEQYNMVTTDKGIEGRLFVSQMGQKLQILYLFNVNMVKQDPKNYPAIRQMFETFTNFGKTLLVVKPESK